MTAHKCYIVFKDDIKFINQIDRKDKKRKKLVFQKNS